YIQGYSGDVR
nr:RecName: Full=Unknown protein 1 [Capsicum chinense]